MTETRPAHLLDDAQWRGVTIFNAVRELKRTHPAWAEIRAAEEAGKEEPAPATTPETGKKEPSADPLAHLSPARREKMEARMLARADRRTRLGA
jgi:hypothetical protein